MVENTMNKLFPITSVQNDKFLVSWPKWQNIKQFDTKKRLLTVLFADIGSYEVGIAIMAGVLSGGEIDVMWITMNTWAQDVNGDYARYLEDMYDIKGVAFNNEDEALRFQDYLEKKYIWKTLQA
jgi:hypothetical protein